MPLNSEVSIDLDAIVDISFEPADSGAPPADTLFDGSAKLRDHNAFRRDWFERTIARPIDGLTANLGQPIAKGPVGLPVLASADPADNASEVIGLCIGNGTQRAISASGSLYLTDWSSVLSAGGNLQAGQTYWVNTVAGGLTSVLPVAGNYIIQVGVARNANVLDFNVQAPILWRV